jgi:monofunctional chorismate mutase
MLEILRRNIDVIDAEIIGLLKRRQMISQKIGEVKAAAGLPIADKERERSVLESLRARAQSDAELELLNGIYSLILSASRDVQSRAVNAEIVTR